MIPISRAATHPPPFIDSNAPADDAEMNEVDEDEDAEEEEDSDDVRH